MDEERDWAEVERQARAAVAELGFLVGSWEGEGHLHGEPVRAYLHVTPAFDGTFLEATERHLDPDGRIDHEDRAFYRYVDTEKRLKVLHLMAPAWTADRVVQLHEEPDGSGVRAMSWESGPFEPRVEWRTEGADGLVCTVRMPFTVEAASVVRYARVDSGSD